MNPSARFGARRALALLLVLGLSGCLGTGQARWAEHAMRPDPPRVPARKPLPPAPRAAPVTAPIQTRALSPTRTPAPVTAAALSPVRVSGAAKRAATGTVRYRVQPRDTIYGIARRMAVPPRRIIEANDLDPPYLLRVGQVLRVRNPRRHIVRAGDTVFGVARRYGVPVTRLMRLNAIKPPYKIASGQDLILPVRAGVRRTPTRAAPPPVPPKASTQSAKLRSAKPAPAAVPRPAQRAGGKFLWPVHGRLITSYGPKRNGQHNDGINIAAPRGAPVRPAENGVVAYLVNELRGFGHLILIKHTGGWVTAYAHNADFQVRRGDTVKRGQVIARIGSSGSVATPQLHFEIRKGARSVDPTRLLGPQRAAAG